MHDPQTLTLGILSGPRKPCRWVVVHFVREDDDP